MKLALVNPNTSQETTAEMVEIAKVASGRAELVGFTARFGAPLITDPARLRTAEGAVVALAPVLRGFDGVVVGAFGDPGAALLRAALDVPVTGLAEAGMAEAASFGRPFAVVTTTPALTTEIADMARRYGHEQFVGTWTPDADPLALSADPEALVCALSAACDQALKTGGAEVILIGGGPLARAAQRLAACLTVPVIEPLPAAVRLALHRARVGSLS
ncbi:MAG: aspartate/glutamate racemase family protein [Pseudomonadota bacterium]